jgi:uncharacterized XkdX family phage protein
MNMIVFDWFKYIKKYYDEGIYTKDDVKVFVAQGYITADQYKQITGDDYVA